jgi:hypothetical protein
MIGIFMSDRNDFKQEIFDKVSKNLLKQNKRARNKDTGSCQYRVGKLKCAAGFLIPDIDYSPKMERTIAVSLNFFPESGYSPEEIEMIGALQYLHDSSEPNTWKRQLKTFAEERDLICNF